MNTNIKEFLKLVNLAGAISLDDGPLLVDGSEISPLTGEPDNEVVCFTWTDGENEFSTVLTEGGISDGSFRSDGKFVCEDQEGNETRVSFFALERLAPVNETQITPCVDSKSRDVYIAAYANDDHDDGPQFARIDASVEFCDRLKKLQALCVDQQLSGVRVHASPAAWGPGDIEDELRLQGGELVVCHSSFWFTDKPKNATYSIETRSQEIEIFINEAEKAVSGPVFLDDLDGEIKKIIEGEIEDSLDAAKVIGEYKDGCFEVVGDVPKAYAGKILGVTPHHVVQSLGRTAVIHKISALDRVPGKNDMLTISYDGKGQGLVGPNSQAVDKSVSR